MDKTDISGTFNAGATLGPMNETNMTRIWNKHKQTNTPLKRKVFVAMSGGVDSSVAAALLKKQGFEVVGVFMKPWSRFSLSESSTRKSRILDSQGESGQPFCLWKQDREDAMRAAAALNIPFLTWDFSREYKKEVGDYMIREYKAGRTPNPDVMCNKHIKFGLFLDKALKEGADYIATGHYVRREPVSRFLGLKVSKFKTYEPKNLKTYKLLTGIDNNKDQSYFLWTLNQKQLKYCLFPIGEYIKPEVRKMAKKFGLPNYDKKDSQGVCFIGLLDMKGFLKKYIKPRPGKIILHALHGHHVNLHGAHVVGEHDGVYYYTIGQRHGLNIGNGQGPYFVTAKDIKKNIIYVTNKPMTNNLRLTTAVIKEVNWVVEPPRLPIKVSVKIRYRSESIPITLSKNGLRYCVTTLTGYKLNAITPGQSAVFYKKEELLGGGVID